MILTMAGRSIGYVWIAHVSLTTLRNLLSLSMLSIVNAFQSHSKPLTKVLFFPDKKIACKSFMKTKKCAAKDCHFSHEETSLTLLLTCLASSRKSLDVCVFTITSQDLADVLIQQHKAGIVVRVITDCEKMDLNCSQIERFRASGIQVRHDKTSYFMHHKFAIVDKKVLINGSFNWTRQAITGNQENVIITEAVDLIKPYCKQFEHLWETYKPE
ncbi:uncharacterized protein LOC130648684 [Hydractinia symbiolongicarpus]|uniref:uncharacterized protein LOC130648684 n=1 Tax=Hydractinia symbiolongicarpus TaxID=13093 RepID=UPI00254E52A6|nr:uncharacterized protein LOC130648684 [Hydractinia symbiolongicarpus]